MSKKIRSISVPPHRDEVWQQAALIAQRRGISMSAFVLQMLERELQELEVPDHQPNCHCETCNAHGA